MYIHMWYRHGIMHMSVSFSELSVCVCVCVRIANIYSVLDLIVLPGSTGIVGSI